MLKTFGDHTQCECLHAGNDFIAGLTVAQHAGQRWDFCNPAPVFFLYELNDKRHSLSFIKCIMVVDGHTERSGYVVVKYGRKSPCTQG